MEKNHVNKGKDGFNETLFVFENDRCFFRQLLFINS